MIKIAFLIIFILINILTIEKPKKKEKWSILYSNPLFLRLTSPNSEHIFADKFWLLSKHIDEMENGENVDVDIFYKVYQNIAVLDSTLEISTIYASTYLASIQERGDLAIEILKIAQKLDPNNFQYLFTELVFQIVYLENKGYEVLKLAKKISKLSDIEKNIGRIDVNKWADDIILYLQKESIKTKIQEVDKIWLKSVE